MMKRYAIVDRESLEIVSTYLSTHSRIESFGGMWGDPTKVMHILIPSCLSDASLQCVYLDQVQAQDEDGELLEHLVPGPTEIAHNSNGYVILDAEGQPLLVSSFEYVPEMTSGYRIVSK